MMTNIKTHDDDMKATCKIPDDDMKVTCKIHDDKGMIGYDMKTKPLSCAPKWSDPKKPMGTNYIYV